MPTKIAAAADGGYDLSNVTTLKDLREEIKFLKASLKKDEAVLEEHFRKMPQEALKAGADAVLPAFVNRAIANGSWKILTSGLGVLANPFKGKQTFSKNILSSAKKLGLIAIIKGAYNLWRNKKAAKPSAVTTLKPVKPVAAGVKKAK